MLKVKLLQPFTIYIRIIFGYCFSPMNFLRCILVGLFLSVLVISCQKDQDVDLNLTKTTAKADSANTLGNFLAVKGTLNIKVGDSSYTFDAAKDSIAFINVNVDSNKYFGITAINKEHTVSFGISSSGSATSDMTKPIAGGQLLFNTGEKNNLQYALSKNIDREDVNKINLIQYMKDSVLTKGSFFTIMDKDGKPNSSYKIQGDFNLFIK